VTRLRTGRGVRVRMLASLVEVHPASGGKNAQRIAGDHRVGFAGATPVDYLGGFLLSAVRHHCACAFHLPSGLRFCSSRSKASEAPGSVHRSPRAMTTRAESTSIVPVQRVGHRQPTGIDRLARAATPEHPMLEEQLNGPPCGLAGAGVTGGRGVLLQTPRCAQRLVERRPVPAAPVVPLPAAVWPLPGDDVLGKSLGSFVGSIRAACTRRARCRGYWHANAAARRPPAVGASDRRRSRPERAQRLLRRAGRWPAPRARPTRPTANARRSTCGTGRPRTHRPHAAPRSTPTPTARPDVCPVRHRVFFQQIATGQVPHRRLNRREQPGHRVRSIGVHNGRLSDHSTDRGPLLTSPQRLPTETLLIANAAEAATPDGEDRGSGSGRSADESPRRGRSY
jgi:hypothetical protein